jgi:hypothetical protein
MKKTLQRRYVESYDNHEGIFVIVILVLGIACIVTGFMLPI